MEQIIFKLEEFKNYQIKFRYSWKSRKLRFLSPLNDLIVHKANVIYLGTCTYKEFYIGETKRNSEVQQTEHRSLNKSCEVGDHLLVNPNYNITWQILVKTLAQTFKQNILEVLNARKLKPTLNSRRGVKVTNIFRNGIM